MRESLFNQYGGACFYRQETGRYYLYEGGKLIMSSSLMDVNSGENEVVAEAKRRGYKRATELA